VAAGEAFSHDQQHRIERAIATADRETGITFSVRVGPVSDEPRLEAERLLANIGGGARDAGVLLLIGPGERVVEVMTTPAARRRISDHAAGLAVLSMVSSFGVGDIVGGIIAGIRQLADAAGAGVQIPPGAVADRADVLEEQELAARAAIAAENPTPQGTYGAAVVIEGEATERHVRS
jgi:uncharacterized membrane protein YgcG